MVLSLKCGGAFEVEHVGSVLHDAEEGGVAVFVPANFTKAFFRKKSAFGAGVYLIPGLLQGVGKVLGCAGGGGEKVEGEALGRAGTDPGQFTEGGDEAKGGGRVIGHQRSTIRASKSFRAALMAGSLRKVSLAEEGAAGGADLERDDFAGAGAGLGIGAGRDAADSARVSDPGMASFFRMVSRLTRSRISHRRRTRISRATSRARERRR